MPDAPGSAATGGAQMQVCPNCGEPGTHRQDEWGICLKDSVQSQVYLRLRVDAGQEPAEIDADIDVYASLPSLDEDNPEPQIQFRFTDEGLIIDVFVQGALVGTSSETYGEIHERLSDGT